MTAYGGAHQRKRREVAKVVARGDARCWRCGRWIRPGEPWDLGHSDALGAKRFGIYRGPEHRHCSRTAGGWKRQGILVSAAPRRTGPRPEALKVFD